MFNTFLYYYVLFIVVLISLNLLIKLSKYLYYYLRNRFFYHGYYYKVNNPLYKSIRYFFIFTPRYGETIFSNYYNFLKITLNKTYRSKLFNTDQLFITFNILSV